MKRRGNARKAELHESMAPVPEMQSVMPDSDYQFQQPMELIESEPPPRDLSYTRSAELLRALDAALAALAQLAAVNPGARAVPGMLERMRERLDAARRLM